MIKAHRPSALLLSCAAIASAFLLLTAAGCTAKPEDPVGTKEGTAVNETAPIEEKTPTRFTGIDFTDYAPEGEELSAWISENSVNMENGPCTRQGIIRSPYFSLKVNGEDVPCFAEKTAKDPHSFAFIEVEEGEAPLSLSLVITTDRERKKPVVLPQSSGVAAECSGNTVSAVIDTFGSFSFTFDGKATKPLTVIVKPAENGSCPEGYTETVYEPGEYRLGTLNFSKPKQFIRFRKGVYTIEAFQINASDVTLYFEPGTLLIAGEMTKKPDGTPKVGSVFAASGKKNVKILGHAVLDLARRTSTGVVFSFNGLKHFEIAGLNIVNSYSWTCCLTNCISSSVRDLTVVGYRTWSDGVMVSDSESVTVSGCFVRTGDDAMEVKSTSSGSVRTKDVLFENNAVWTDKGIAYGCVYESNFSQSDVTWRNNSVGFALADWSDHLGCVTVSIHGENPEIEDHRMYFENIEIYKTCCAVISVVMHKGGNIHDIHFKNIRAEEVRLNPAVQKSAIEIRIKNEDKGPVSDFRLDRLYFDSVSWGREKLTKANAASLIRFSVPSGFKKTSTLLNINTDQSK